MNDVVELKNKGFEELSINDDPLLYDTFKVAEGRVKYLSEDVEQEWDAPLDLRVNRPRAIDLKKFWALTNNPLPPSISAAIGPSIPILLTHVVTPFAADGAVPGRVWGLGYEIILHNVNANTISVVPNDTVLKIGEVGEKVELGLDLGGGIGLPEEAMNAINDTPAIHIEGATLKASTNMQFQMSLHLEITLKKILGAPVGTGGALWKMYRQDEPLDKPHTLLQTLLIEPDIESIQCTIRTWAKQAGFLGTRLGARKWNYDDAHFDIDLKGLTT